MSDNPSIGHILDIQPKSQSRREVTASTGVTGSRRLTLMPGVLESDDAVPLIRQMADLEALAYAPTPPRRIRRGGA